MCGIFGAIGNRINPGIIRALAIVNRARGVDSLGFFNSNGKIVKAAGDPMDCLGYADFDRFIKSSCRKGWFLAGHTRHATLGSVVTRNAHPFRYGRFIGCHNGIVDIPLKSKYRVDSQFLFDRLNQHNGNYQEAFADINGYWALAWFDGESFYLQAHDNEVWIGRDKTGTWYYSSDSRHLLACAGELDCIECIGWGKTIRFDRKYREYQVCPDFVPAYYDDWDNWNKEEELGANPFYDDVDGNPADPFYVGGDEDSQWARLAEYDARMEEYVCERLYNL
jgi:asparagine synthetase B (glutamine-hydrolysing)